MVQRDTRYFGASARSVVASSLTALAAQRARLREDRRKWGKQYGTLGTIQCLLIGHESTQRAIANINMPLPG